MARGRAWIGTSGWNYPHWGRGVFYPPGLPASRWLAFYAGRFSTVEVNNTFYRMPRPDLCRRWAAAVPADFVFALKVPGLFTHRLRLAAPAELVARFLDAVSTLGDRLGPLLVQLPPRARADPERLDGFLALLTGEARARGLPARVACEFREEGWFAPEVLAVLARHGAALCVADWPWPDGFPPHATGAVSGQPFLYVRRHGPRRYSDADLARLARLVRRHLETAADAYVYFNNDARGWAVADALALGDMIRPDRTS